MKITIYTISDCYFSKQEKDYLASHNLPFEEKNLEENRDFLTEMLTISNNFAGTPVSKIEKDDGNIVVLKGFTKDEFDQTFGFVDTAPVASAEPSAPSASAPVVAPAPVVEPVMPVVQPVVAAPVAPAAPASPDMDSIASQIEQLKRLQASLAQQTAAAPAPVVPAPAPFVQPIMPQPVVPAAVAQPVAPVVPVAAPTQAGMDDSLAAILAELQTKINAQPGTPPAQNPPTTN